MVKLFGDNERFIKELFTPGSEFEYNNEFYQIIYSDKPTCPHGEPKTDIYAKCKNLKDYSIKEFKISLKSENADFLENKISAERAEQLLGDDWQHIIYNSLLKIKSNFKKKKLIYKKRDWPTRKGSITLGWKFEFVNKESGLLSEQLNLSTKQLIDIYAGSNLNRQKKDAYIKDQIVKNSGIANYIIEYTPDGNESLQDIINMILPIKTYIAKNNKIFFACKALNYRTFKNKYDGNRPLAVYIDWNIKNEKLYPEYVFNEPLMKRGNYVAENLIQSLKQLNIKTTEDINSSNVCSLKYIHK
jgi:hypothetical protein